MPTYYVVAWHENNEIIDVEAPSAVAACRRLGLNPKRCLVSQRRGDVMVCPYMLDLVPASGVYTDDTLASIREHARRCRTCSRITRAVLDAFENVS